MSQKIPSRPSIVFKEVESPKIIYIILSNNDVLLYGIRFFCFVHTYQDYIATTDSQTVFFVHSPTYTALIFLVQL